jgi:hypothetical protein
VANRRALLIGAESYGEGFAPLPAVREDVELLRSALQAAGYETEICPPQVMTNATQLDASIRDFCRSGGDEDIRLLYFTGHGLRVDGTDWIVPAGASRKDAAVSPNQRVSTDLSATVAESAVGLVLFIIDACRDREDVPVTKGGGAWGDSTGIMRPSEPRFVRYFGCAADQLCQVVGTAPEAGSASLFTKALAESLADKDCVSLEELQTQVERRCNEMLAASPQLQAQTPRVSYGELSVEKKAILKRPIFDPVGAAALGSVWPSFDPNKLHCLVVLSEYEHEHAEDWGLKDLVSDAITGATGDRIWNAFHAACNEQKLVSGRQRALPKDFDPSALALGSFSVLDAFASAEALDRAVRALAEADLVVFDVTGFEPGVMLLVGVRSTCRRGLSVCSHGAKWKEGQQLENLPFNLQDLNLNSHTRSDTLVGSDPVVERFVRRIETGFAQLSKHPHYLDLPGYDSLRQLGSDYAASSTIPVTERILVLCSYDKDFRDNWQFIAVQLKSALWDKNKNIKPRIERIIDYGTPQLVLQGLYEQIRRTAACVVDWTQFSPSVFLELGARLAVSEWGAVQIIDERYLEERNLPVGDDPRKLSQVQRMRRLLAPISYRRRTESKTAFQQVADALLRRSPNLDDAAAAGYNRVYRALLPVIDSVQAALPPVAQDLKREADALHHPMQGQIGAPQVLFSGSRLIKQDAERTALELRVAAWLYLEHRVGAARRKADVETADLYRELGKAALDALYDLGDDESIELAAHIEKRLNHPD